MELSHKLCVTDRPEWQALMSHSQEMQATSLNTLFQQDPRRFSHFSLEAAGLLLDYSKRHMTQETGAHLCRLAHACRVPEAIEALCSGETVNFTEQQPALHTHLRAPADAEPASEQMPRMRAISEAVRSGAWVGYSGQAITDIVHIGIGGSYLGPRLAFEALQAFSTQCLRLHFVAHMEAEDCAEVLSELRPETTLVVVVSKSFRTEETLRCVEKARLWLRAAAGPEVDTAQHFLAVTAHKQRAMAAQFSPEHILLVPTTVIGRYSLWSYVSIAVAISVGMDVFEDLLHGAARMDAHVRSAPLAQNMPVMLALIDIWYADFLHYPTRAVIPYDDTLRTFLQYVQQLEMESNGKQVDANGKKIAYATAPIVWGGLGPESQHSFHQLLFQGTHRVSIDFIVAAHRQTHAQPQEQLIAHCFSQSKALMEGRSEANVLAALIEQGHTPEQARALAPHQSVPGNVPSSTLLMPRVDAHTLGALLALYEHKVFVSAVMWEINPFDQWGVELGKALAQSLLGALSSLEHHPTLDASTKGLMMYYQKHTTR